MVANRKATPQETPERPSARRTRAHPQKVRRELQEYFMRIAYAVRKRAKCQGRRVGAVLALSDRVVATGYNGTPAKMQNCDEGGCHRCANPDQYPAGTAYDVCICVHAEQNALISAARFGIPTEGAIVYSTMTPCFGCAKELLQAKVQAVYYRWPWFPTDPDLLREHKRLLRQFPRGVYEVKIDDPDAEWAMAGRTGGSEDTGHSILR